MTTRFRTIRCQHGFDVSQPICPECRPEKLYRHDTNAARKSYNPNSKPGGRRYKTRELVRV